MQSIKNLVKVLFILSFVFADECRSLDTPESCYQTEECFWNEDLNYCQGYDNNDWENECRFLESEDECIDAGCMWDDEEGCYDYWDDEEDVELECVMDCEGVEDVNPDEDMYGFCEWLVSLDESCLSDCDDDTLEEILEFYEFCSGCLEDNSCGDDWDDEEGEDDEEDWEEGCEGLDEYECNEVDGCEWNYSNNLPGGGFCSESDWDDEEDEEDDEDDDNQANGLIKLDSIISQPGSIVEIDVYMESNVNVGGFQFNVIDEPDWVEGLEIESHIDCFEASLNDVNGYLIAIMFSLEGCSIDPTNEMNQVATIHYALSDNAQFGENVELILDNLIVSDDNGDPLAFDSISGNIMVGGQSGDVNLDGDLNILDIVQTINFILLIADPSDNEFITADINSDGSLDILDIVGMINLIQRQDRVGHIDIDSEAYYSIENNQLELSANSVSGFQIKLENKSNVVDSNLPSDWYIYSSNGIVLAYTMNNSFNGKIKLNFSDNIQVEDFIVSDSYGNEIQSTSIIEPVLFSLNKSYPNPFNPTTTISFDLYDNLNSSIKIYNISGQLVDVLYDGYLDIGHHSLTWNALNQVSGIYLMSLQFGTTVKTQKLMLIK